jgi:hypothetical protein
MLDKSALDKGQLAKTTLDEDREGHEFTRATRNPEKCGL